MAGIQSVLSNSQPIAGTGAQQPIPANNVPADIAALAEQLTPIQQRFRSASSFLKVPLNTLTFTGLGQSQNGQITSVGLGVKILSEHNAVITVANGVTAAETFTVSKLFPYNIESNCQVQINGGATVFSAGGVATLVTMTRQRQVSRRSSTLQNNFGPGLDPSLMRITLGSNLTATNSAVTAQSLSGIASISVAGSASTLNTITVAWYTIEKLAYDADSLIGALPLQNNSTYANIQRTIVGSLSTTAGLSSTVNQLNTVFYSAGADLTFTLTSYNVQSTYVFASVPSDPGLYLPMISNSYQIQEATNLVVTATGTLALLYNIPQNQFLIAAHVIGTDGNGAVLTPTSLGRLVLQYNGGSLTPVVEYQGRQRAEQFLMYGYDAQWALPGVRTWDGDATSDDINATDMMGWLDAYSAATPQIGVDVPSGTAVNIQYNLARESIVAGSVSVIGG